MTESPAEQVFAIRAKLADTPEAQVRLALSEGHPHWMKYGGEPKLSYDVDPCRRVYMLSDAAWHGRQGARSPWRITMDSDAGRTMRFVRR